MKLSIDNTVQNSWIFILLFVAALLATLRWKKTDGTLSPSVTRELKGFAILSVVFAHVGYFLVADDRFLFPLSIVAGIGVNMFLFVSGYGLTASRLGKDETRAQFYKRKLLGLYVPFWIAGIALVLADYFFLHVTRNVTFLLRGFFGIFTTADMYTDLNSPLWYMTVIVFFYVLFPILFSKKYPWLTAAALYVAAAYVIRQKPDLFQGVLGLYKIHAAAFPLGVFCAWLGQRGILSRLAGAIRRVNVSSRGILYYALMFLLAAAFCYGAVHSGVGEKPRIEQGISIAVMLAAILFFMLKKFESRLLALFGAYSYEIYLIHWPLMYRHDVLYANVPAWLATVLYLALFVGLAWVLKRVAAKVSALFSLPT